MKENNAVKSASLENISNSRHSKSEDISNKLNNRELLIKENNTSRNLHKSKDNDNNNAEKIKEDSSSRRASKNNKISKYSGGASKKEDSLSRTFLNNKNGICLGGTCIKEDSLSRRISANNVKHGKHSGGKQIQNIGGKTSYQKCISLI